MKVALYKHHHHLPFWSHPQNPNMLFDPEGLEGWTYQCIESHEIRPAVQHHMMPVLNGLLAIDLLGVMANFSLWFDLGEKTVTFPRRMWTQITTEPAEWDEAGLPIIVQGEKVQVAHLWGKNNAINTCSPFDFLGSKKVKGEDTPEFWTEFFIGKIREAKEGAVEELEEAKKAVTGAEQNLERYAIIF